MKRISMLIAAGLFLLAAAIVPTIRAVAQQAVVTDENVNQMIGSAKTPAEHEAIATYFDEKAAKAEQDAKNHRAWGNIYGKPAMMSHCSYLAKANQDEADQYKALANGHQGACPMHQRHQQSRGSHHCCQTAACNNSTQIRVGADSHPVTPPFIFAIRPPIANVDAATRLMPIGIGLSPPSTVPLFLSIRTLLL